MYPAATGGPEAREAYLTSPDKRKHFYHTLNHVIAKYNGSGPNIIGSTPTMADAAIFAYLWDDVVVFKGDEYLWVANPKLQNFFKAFLEQEPVMAWCKSKRPDIVEGKPQ
jgi:glutathione S-transferase